MNTSFTQIGEYVINKKMKDGFRVVAFNVHYFCDFNGTPQIKNIFKVK